MGDKTDLSDMFFLRMKGLPWHSTEDDVINFFLNIHIEREWVHVIRMPDGRDSGECLVGIRGEAPFDLAMSYDKNFMGKRYIELYKASEEEWVRITTRTHRVNEVPINTNSFVVLMRGLPYSAQEDDCISFFQTCNCLGVHLTKDRFGRPSGQGYAEFATEDDFTLAMQLDRSHMQNRYIELFKSSVPELVLAMSNSSGRGEGKNRGRKNYKNKNVRTFPSLYSHRGYHKEDDQLQVFVVQMMGLPKNCTEDMLKEFFQDPVGEKVYPARAHLKSDGTEAFVEFRTFEEFERALTRNKSEFQGNIVEIYRSSFNQMKKKMNKNHKKRMRYPPDGPIGPNLTLHSQIPSQTSTGFQDGGALYQFPPEQLMLTSSFPPSGQSPTNFVPPISPGNGFSHHNPQIGYQFGNASYAPYHVQTFTQQTSIVAPTGNTLEQSQQRNVQIPNTLAFQPPVFSPSPNCSQLFTYPPQFSSTPGSPNGAGAGAAGAKQLQASYAYTPRR